MDQLKSTDISTIFGKVDFLDVWVQPDILLDEIIFDVRAEDVVDPESKVEMDKEMLWVTEEVS